MTNGCAIVTGGASGIGEAAVLKLLADGISVMAVDRDGAALSRLASEHSTDRLKTFEADVASPQSIEEMVEAAVGAFGALRYLVNAAGITSSFVQMQYTNPEDFDRVCGVNLKGTFLCMRAAIPHMHAAGGGAIVNIASSAGIRPLPLDTPYTASKWGVVGITMTAAVEYAPQGIRVNAVCPGVTDTPLFQRVGMGHGEAIAKKTPLGRLGTSSDMAEAIVWLLSDRASYITGAVLPVDGGLTLV